MLLRYLYDKALAHASYLVGCQKTNEAIIIDPGRDVDQYFELAKQENLNIVGVAETHIHADYVSGAREMADRHDIKLYISDAGPDDWKYQFANDYRHQFLKDGDQFQIGNLRFDVLHTPGHTPESLSFLLTDEGGGADKPMGIFTGDFIFVGSIGRPDLLEKAAGMQGTALAGAKDLFQSVKRFKKLPDHLQVWPAHGAGSACGKDLGAVPTSTVGYEKLFNPALQIDDEKEFIRYILEDQPEAPTYFKEMKRVNKVGPNVLGDQQPPTFSSVDSLRAAMKNGTVVDLVSSKEFANAHVPGSLNIPLSMLADWAGWLVDYSRPLYVIASADQLPEATRIFQKIGIDHFEAAFDRQEILVRERATQSYESRTPEALAEAVISGKMQVIDVRKDTEWKQGHLPNAQHRFLGTLANELVELPRDRPLITQCQSGARSAIGASLLQLAGFDVINMTGGYNAWAKNDLPIVEPTLESKIPANA